MSGCGFCACGAKRRAGSVDASPYGPPSAARSSKVGGEEEWETEEILWRRDSNCSFNNNSATYYGFESVLVTNSPVAGRAGCPAGENGSRLDSSVVVGTGTHGEEEAEEIGRSGGSCNSGRVGVDGGKSFDNVITMDRRRDDLVSSVNEQVPGWCSWEDGFPGRENSWKKVEDGEEEEDEIEFPGRKLISELAHDKCIWPSSSDIHQDCTPVINHLEEPEIEEPAGGGLLWRRKWSPAPSDDISSASVSHRASQCLCTSTLDHVNLDLKYVDDSSRASTVSRSLSRSISRGARAQPAAPPAPAGDEPLKASCETLKADDEDPDPDPWNPSSRKCNSVGDTVDMFCACPECCTGPTPKYVPQRKLPSRTLSEGEALEALAHSEVGDRLGELQMVSKSTMTMSTMATSTGTLEDSWISSISLDDVPSLEEAFSMEVAAGATPSRNDVLPRPHLKPGSNPGQSQWMRCL